MSTMDDIRKLVGSLTFVRFDFIGGHPVQAPALLDELRDAASASVGGSGSSGSSAPNERTALNIAAFTMYEDITGRIGEMYASSAEQRLRPTKDPKHNLRGWLDAFEHDERLGEVNATQLRVQRQRLASFVERITDLSDPPSVKEITGSCPVIDCGERYWTIDREGTRTSTLYVQIRPGQALTARCHWCGSTWTGETQLEDLAVELSADEWEKNVRRKLAHWRALCASFSPTA
jgi:hypothetical protein